MPDMSTSTVVPIEAARERSARVARAIDARRALEATERRSAERHGGGRAWLNGSELGGARAAFAHLGESYD